MQARAIATHGFPLLESGFVDWKQRRKRKVQELSSNTTDNFRSSKKEDFC